MDNAVHLERLRQITSVEREFQRRAAEYNNAGGSASVTADPPNGSHGILANGSSKGKDEEEEMEPRQKKVVSVYLYQLCPPFFNTLLFNTQIYSMVSSS